MFEVHLTARSIEPFVDLVGPERVTSVRKRADAARAMLGGHAVWNVNSTAVGGGVAEMLRSVLRYARGLGVDVRWAVMQGPPEFFRVTKRLHNALHDDPGDGSPLGEEQAALYREVSRENALALDDLMRPGDVVICHDPQTAGLVSHLVARGARVIWRCHIGYDHSGREVDAGWAFLRPCLEHAPIAVFSREAYAPAWVSPKRTIVLAPTIDPFSAKNQYIAEAAMISILRTIGVVEGHPYDALPAFVRDDGSQGRVDRKAEILRLGRAPAWDTPLVVQVSRWDRMKDPIGVLTGFNRLLGRAPKPTPALVLAGPTVRGVADDPESPEVFREVEDAWRALPDALRDATHLVQLPMGDTEENAAMVNALQRHATVIVQKSLREGFGLTVTEALWKKRPVVASAVGGIQDQIRDGVDGLLVRDPTSADEFANALARLLDDQALASRLAESGYERARTHYLSLSGLEHWSSLIELVTRG